MKSDLPRINFTEISQFSFFEPDNDRFPALEMSRKALLAGGTVPAVMNSANETAVKLFLERKIRFNEIVEIIQRTIDNHKIVQDPTLSDILQAEKWAVEEVLVKC